MEDFIAKTDRYAEIIELAQQAVKEIEITLEEDCSDNEEFLTLSAYYDIFSTMLDRAESIEFFEEYK